MHDPLARARVCARQESPAKLIWDDRIGADHQHSLLQHDTATRFLDIQPLLELSCRKVDEYVGARKRINELNVPRGTTRQTQAEHHTLLQRVGQLENTLFRQGGLGAGSS